MPQSPAVVVEGGSEGGFSTFGGSQHHVWHHRKGRSLLKWWVLHCPLFPTWWPSCNHSTRARGVEHAMHGMQHLSKRALLWMPRRCTQRALRTVRQRVMPYFPQATIVKSTIGRNRATAHVPSQSIVNSALCMARVIGNPPPPPCGVALVVIFVDATSIWKASST